MWLLQEQGRIGQFSFNRRGLGRSWLPHRLSFHTFVRAIPGNSIVAQSCKNDMCVNPGHLSVGARHEVSNAAADLSGLVFGSLTVIKRVRSLKKGGTHWECLCTCGGSKITTTSKLRSRGIISCGCFRHGQTETPTYRSWQSMNSRCNNPRNPSYDTYGGRGITIHPPWRRFQDFFAYMGERPEGTSLDRIDPNGNYEPGNVRWSSADEQLANRRCDPRFLIKGFAHRLAEVRVGREAYSRSEVEDMIKGMCVALTGTDLDEIAAVD